MNQSTFTVTRFTNRNGISSWRVDGRPTAGFKLKVLADAKTGTAFLIDDQLREAEGAFRRLAGQPHSIGSTSITPWPSALTRTRAWSSTLPVSPPAAWTSRA